MSPSSHVKLSGIVTLIVALGIFPVRNASAQPTNAMIGQPQAEGSAQLDATLARYYEIYASVLTFEDRIAQSRKSAGVQPQQVEIVKSVEDKFQQHVHSATLPANSTPHIQAEVANSDLIVIGTPIKARSLPIEDHTFAFTQYAVRVEKVVANDQNGLLPGDTIIVSRGGGELTVDNVLIKAIEPAFSEFLLTQSYVLMLRAIPGTTTYRALGSGTYAVRNGEVFSASNFDKRTTAKKELSSFIADIDSAIERKRSAR